MRHWPRWLEFTGVVLVALFASRSWTSTVQPGWAHAFGFWACFAMMLCWWGLSFLPNQPFLALKGCFAVLTVLGLRHFNAGFRRGGIVNFVAVFIIVIASTWLGSYRTRGPWWPAFKRTVRRLRGDWREDDARFADKILDDRKN